MLGIALSPTTVRSARELPYRLPGLALDIDLAKGVTEGGGTISAIVDQTGSGNDLVQATGANQPAYVASDGFFAGRPSATFDGVNDRLAQTGGSPITDYLTGSGKAWTFAVVFRRASKTTATETLLSFGRSAATNSRITLKQLLLGTNDDSRTEIVNDAATTVNINDPAKELWEYGPQVGIWTSDGGEVAKYLIGSSRSLGRGLAGNFFYDRATDLYLAVTSTYSGTLTLDQWGIGAMMANSTSQFWSGSIARVLGRQRELTGSEIEQLGAYLARRYLPKMLSPSDMLGLYCWCDASEEGTVGQTLQVLSDQTANGLDFVQNDVGKRPTVRLHASGNQYLEFDGSDDGMTAGIDADDWKFLHDGAGQWTMGIVFRVRDEDRDALEPLLDTVNDDVANNTGAGVYYDNRSSVPAVRRLRLKVGATNATAIADIVSADNAARSDAWQLAIATFEPTVPTLQENFRLLLDSQLVIEADKAGTPDAGNPTTTALTLGKLAASAVHAKIDVAEIFIWNDRCLSSYEQRKLGEYVARKWGEAHVAVAAGNGIANVVNDATPTRGYPAAAFDATGRLHVGYRRAADDAGADSEGVMISSDDGVAFAKERVILPLAAGVDHRFSGPQIRLTVAPYAGRLLSVYAFGGPADPQPGSVRVLYSDDNGATWQGPVEVNPNDVGDTGGFDSWSYGHGATVELPTGEILTFYSAKKTTEATYPHVVIMESTDGGLTWSGNGAGKSRSVFSGVTAGFQCLYPSVVRFPSDGLLLVAMRDNTNARCRSVESDDDGDTWSAATDHFDANSFHGMVVDENERLYIFYRAKVGTTYADRAVWRYSDDRGDTWSAERTVDNRSDYGQSAWLWPLKDDAGNIWLVYSHLTGNDADTFCRLWRRKP